jgi:hypothetical protein
MGRRVMHIGFWWKVRMKENNWEDLDLDRRVILRWILERYDAVVRTGLIWLTLGTSGGLL